MTQEDDVRPDAGEASTASEAEDDRRAARLREVEAAIELGERRAAAREAAGGSYPAPRQSRSRTVATATEATATEARGAFEKILQSEQSLHEGRAERDRIIIDLRKQGMSLRGISAALRDQALAAGVTEQQLGDLGISYSAVNTVLQRWESVEKYMSTQTVETEEAQP